MCDPGSPWPGFRQASEHPLIVLLVNLGVAFSFLLFAKLTATEPAIRCRNAGTGGLPTR